MRQEPTRMGLGSCLRQGCLGMILFSGLTLGLFCLLEYGRVIDRELFGIDSHPSLLPYVEEYEVTAGAEWRARPWTTIPGASHTQIRSPDNRYSILSRNLLFNYHIYLRDLATGEETPIVTIREADPGSGAAHRFSWSRDSRIVYFSGQGRVYAESDTGDLEPLLHVMPMIYCVETDVLASMRGTE